MYIHKILCFVMLYCVMLYIIYGIFISIYFIYIEILIYIYIYKLSIVYIF